MKATSALSVLPPLMEFIGGVAFAAALWYGSQEIAAARLTTGEFVGFIAALFMMYGPAKKLSRVNANLQQAIAAAERIFEMLETHSEVRERAGAVDLPRFRDAIEFRDVGFAYHGTDEVTLRGISLVVRGGQTLAIVGRSGVHLLRKGNHDFIPIGMSRRPDEVRSVVYRALMSTAPIPTLSDLELLG